MLHGSRTNNALRTSRNAPWRSGCSQTLSRSVGRPNTFRPSQTLSGPMPGASWPAGSPLPPRPPPPAPAPEAAMGMLGSTCRVGAAACAVISARWNRDSSRISAHPLLRWNRDSSRISAHPLLSTAHGAMQRPRPRRQTPYGSTDAPRQPRHLGQHLSPSSKMHAAPRNLQHRLCHLCPLT